MSLNVCNQSFDGRADSDGTLSMQLHRKHGSYDAIIASQYNNRFTVAYNVQCAKRHAKLLFDLNKHVSAEYSPGLKSACDSAKRFHC